MNWFLIREVTVYIHLQLTKQHCIYLPGYMVCLVHPQRLVEVTQSENMAEDIQDKEMNSESVKLYVGWYLLCYLCRLAVWTRFFH